MEKTIEMMLENAVASQVAAQLGGIKARLLTAIDEAFDGVDSAPAPKRRGRQAKTAKAVTKVVKKTTKGKTKSAADMRCRKMKSDGKQCKERSKGPRFRFLCEDHLKAAAQSAARSAAGKKAAKKKPVKKVAKKQVAKKAAPKKAAPVKAAAPAKNHVARKKPEVSAAASA